jgi:DNA-binding TFAR19-related protein (PDSD5 family)
MTVVSPSWGLTKSIRQRVARLRLGRPDRPREVDPKVRTLLREAGARSHQSVKAYWAENKRGLD